MDEVEIELATVNSLMEDHDNYMNDFNKAVMMLADINKTGVNQGLMIAFESSRYEDQSPLGAPIGMFTSEYSMSGLEYAVEGFKDRALKAWRKAKSLAQRAAMALYNAIMKLFGKIKTEKVMPDKDIEIDVKACLKELNDFSKANKLNSWCLSSSKNPSELMGLVERFLINTKEVKGAFSLFNDKLKEIVASDDVRKIIDTDLNFSDVEGKFDELNQRADEIKTSAGIGINVEKQNLFRTFILDSGITSVKPPKTKDQLYVAINAILENASISSDRNPTVLDSYNPGPMVLAYDEVKESSANLRDEVKSLKDDLMMDEAIEESYVIRKLLDNGQNMYNDAEMYMSALGKVIDLGISHRRNVLTQLTRATQATNVIVSTLNGLSGIVINYDPSLNKA